MYEFQAILQNTPLWAAIIAWAAAQGIKVQRDIMRAGGTDAGAIHLTRSGVPTGGFSVPCRYVHTPVEAASLKDIEECVRLTVAFAQAELA